MTIGLVQSTSKVVTGVNNTTLAYGSNVTAGNLIAVTQSQWRSTASTITTPTDTLGHAYTGMAAEQSANNTRLRSFYVANISGGANTVTFDISDTATGEMAVTVAEFSGALTASPLEAATSAGPTLSTTPSSGDVTPSVNNCLLYGAMTNDSNNVTVTEEAGWTLLEKQVPVSSIPVATEWKLQGTAAAEDADWTLASEQLWIAHVAAFKPAVVAAVKAKVDQMFLHSKLQGLVH